jgi:hypothetical protein
MLSDVSVPRSARLGSALFGLGLVGWLVSLLGFGWLQHHMPDGIVSAWGNSPRSAGHFRQVLWGGEPTPLDDTYLYVGFARLHLVHGINPYEAPVQTLRTFGDPTPGFLVWNWLSPYLPVWAFLSEAVLAPLAGASLWGKVVAFKLLAAALAAMTWAGQAVTRHFQPAYAPLTVLALEFNPFLVLEGPVNGHNEWPLGITLTRWDRRHLVYTGGCCLLAWILTFRYISG